MNGPPVAEAALDLFETDDATVTVRSAPAAALGLYTTNLPAAKPNFLPPYLITITLNCTNQDSVNNFIVVQWSYIYLYILLKVKASQPTSCLTSTYPQTEPNDHPVNLGATCGQQFESSCSSLSRPNETYTVYKSGRNSPLRTKA